MKMQTFGEKIREMRNRKGFTLTQLAAELSIDSANLSKIENGKRDFDERRIPELCSIFHLDVKEVQRELLSEKFALKVCSANLDCSVFELAERKVKFFNEKNTIQAEFNL